MPRSSLRPARLLLGLSVAAAAMALPASTAGARVPPASQSRIAVDPVGNYEWSLTMTALQNTEVNGTLSITRKDSTLAATLTSDHSDGEIVARSVSQDRNKVTVASEGDFGEFTLVIDFGGQEPTASFKFVGQDGSADQGPVTIKRVEKK
jgi:hypothetical protein